MPGSGAGAGPAEMPPDLAAILDVLCPMHLMLSDEGHVLHCGPTLAKLRPDTPFRGARFLERFEVTRPRRLSSMPDLLAAAGGKLHLALRDAPRTALKGCLAPWGRGVIVNLSFGISILDAVRDYALTAADFAATDMTVEIL